MVASGRSLLQVEADAAGPGNRVAGCVPFLSRATRLARRGCFTVPAMAGGFYRLRPGVSTLIAQVQLEVFGLVLALWRLTPLCETG